MSPKVIVLARNYRSLGNAQAPRQHYADAGICSECFLLFESNSDFFLQLTDLLLDAFMLCSVRNCWFLVPICLVLHAVTLRVSHWPRMGQLIGPNLPYLELPLPPGASVDG